MSSQEKITVYNLADLKNTSDDAIPNYLNSLKFSQSHTLTDTRLALGYGAFLVAGACFLWDYKLGFENTKYYTAAAVAIYTILNGALTFWIWGVEKGTVYVGTSPGGDKVSISTTTKKNVPIYDVTITINRNGSTKPEVIHLARPFTEWFDTAGHFIASPFQTMLATSVNIIGKLDPKRAMASSSAGAQASDTKYSAEMLEMLAASAPELEGTQSSTGSLSNKKGGKRRKA